LHRAGLDRRTEDHMRALVLVLTLAFSTACNTNPTTPTVGTSPPPPPTRLFDLAGNYRLTLTPSPKCATVVDRVTGKPTPFPTVSFDMVALTQQDSMVSLAVQGTSGGDTLSGGLTGNQLQFFTRGPVGPITCDEAFAAWTSANELFGMGGTGYATVDDPQQISGKFDGCFEYVKRSPISLTDDQSLECEANDHRFSLNRR
jgi:hypothetical protein